MGRGSGVFTRERNRLGTADHLDRGMRACQGPLLVDSARRIAQRRRREPCCKRSVRGCGRPIAPTADSLSSLSRRRVPAPSAPHTSADQQVSLELVRTHFHAEYKQREGRPNTNLRFKLDLPVGSRRYIFSLAGYELDDDEAWDESERSTVNKLARDGRGRVLFVIDREARETMVAIGFSHRDKPSDAFLIHAFALRREPELVDLAEALAFVAKRCLHFIAVAYGRPGHLLYDVRGGKEDFAKAFAFRRASEEREAIGKVGGTLMVQDAPEI